MKNYLIILSLFFVSCAYGYRNIYMENPQQYRYCPCYSPFYTGRTINQPIYTLNSNHYNPYFKTYSVTRTNYSPNIPHKLKRMRRLEKRRLNQVSFLNRNKGSLTGYSLPITKQDVYNQMGISPYNPKSKQKHNSINCSQELFSAPSGDEMYYNNGKYYKDLKGTSAKTGVTIIYD